MHGLGITSFTYLPLSLANPQEACSLIAKAEQSIERQRASGSLPPGLTEQYDVQVAALKDESIPDLEIAMFPSAFLGAVSACLALPFFTLLRNNVFCNACVASTPTVWKEICHPRVDPEPPLIARDDCDVPFLDRP